MSAPTILLIPAAGDPHGLLVPGRCGGRVPTMYFGDVPGKSRPCPVCSAPVKWFRPPTDQMDPCYICSKDWRHKFAQEDVTVQGWLKCGLGAPNGAKLALVLSDAQGPIPEGIFRLWHLADDAGGSDLMDALYEEHADIAAWAATLRRNGELLGEVVCLPS